MAKKSNEEPTFETLLAEAEVLAERMEEGGLSLDECVKAYEKGIANLRQCAALLKETEAKVKLLVEKDSGFVLEDAGYDEVDGDGDEE